MNWTDADLAKWQNSKEVNRDTNPNDRRNLIGADLEPAPVRKYRNVTKEVDGIVFDSCKEAKVYLSLKYRQQAGEIKDLSLQPRFLLQEGFLDAQGKKHRDIHYVGDFMFSENGRTVVVDVKGYLTPSFRIKEKLMRSKFPKIDFQIWK